MSPFSFFSSIHISERIESFRQAEHHLFEFAKTRFTHHEDQESSNHHFELFDTPIKVPSVIQKGCAAASCQVHDNEDAENYSLHGVKVVNKLLATSFDNDTTTNNNQPAPLILLHGYANGSLYFYRNLMGLSHHFETIYALDMLGWGLSSRPKFDLILADSNDNDNNGNDDCKNTNSEDILQKQTKQQVSSAESFFVESLESWRQHHNLPKLTLAGHSMGGYLSVAYAERYPQHVEKLILLSPVGVPERQPEDESKINAMPFYIRAMVKTSRYLFNKGITPGSFLRSLPFSRSKAMVDGYILNRLPAISCEEERVHLGEYLYQNSMLPGSGECCLNEILTAGAFAKIPLVHRIPNIKTASVDGSGNDDDNGEGMEVHMIYGQNDWMDFRGGLETQRVCHQKRLEWEQQQKSLISTNNNNCPPPRVFVRGVKDASHLLMLDNYQEFNAALIIASGGEDKLLPNALRPVEFVCDEVAARRSIDTSSSATRSRHNVAMGEEGAAEFFRGARWSRKSKEESQVVEDDLEEKKVEEQELA